MGQPALPAILVEDFRRLLEAPGRVVIDLVSLAQHVVPIVRFAGGGNPLEMMGVILDGDEILRGSSAAIALARLQLLAGRFDAVELIGDSAEMLGPRH